MTNRISDLKTDQPVRVRFHGSKRLGNDPYELDLIFKHVQGIGDDARAIFDFGDDSDFEVYKVNGRWCYGTSAEKLSIIC